MKLKIISIILVLILTNSYLNGCNRKVDSDSNNVLKEVVSIKAKAKIDETKEEKYEKYINPRFGYDLSYPEKFKITKESDNGDGVELNFEDSKIIVYGSNNVLQDSAKGLYESELKEISKKDLINSSLEKNTYFITWKEGNFLKYKKSIVGEESINSFEVIYPSSKEKEFIYITGKLSESFKTPNVDKMG